MKNYSILLSLLLVASLAFGQNKDTSETKDVKADVVTQTENTPAQEKDSAAKAVSSAHADTAKQVAKTTTVKTDSLSHAKTPTTHADSSKHTSKTSSDHVDASKSTAKAPMSKVDSLTHANQKLAGQLDSTYTVLEKYQALYIAIKEKIFKHDFDPARMSQIIDSLTAKKDTSFSGISSSTAFLKDSISILNLEILRLKTKYSEVTIEDLDKARLVRELRQLKELLDTKILTQSEFDIKKSMILEKWQ